MLLSSNLGHSGPRKQAALNPSLIARCRPARVIPVLTILDAKHAVPLAHALFNGGLSVLEITLRTPAALEAIQLIKDHGPDADVGAGTVLTSQQAEAARKAGARFLVSPGATWGLLEEAEQWSIPLLPGIATASEAMALLERGYRFAKFFPAESSGGIAALKALGAPLADLTFCPTGGVGPANLAAYLACPNVACVGGSWVAPQAMIDASDWEGITKLARKAHELFNQGLAPGPNF
jgi:2-dehydro-3-deoxyphosphogluconate aldolase / (4S)-4-hydroxy-2-oxoglutarate aldolase